MRRWIGATALLVSSVALAAVDLSDFDDDLMRSMDDAIKVLEPDVTANNVAAATEGVAVLKAGFKWTEEYFAAKGNAADAVQFARESDALADQVTKHLEAKDIDAAAAAARQLAKSCKTCHEAYKP